MAVAGFVFFVGRFVATPVALHAASLRPVIVFVTAARAGRPVPAARRPSSGEPCASSEAAATLLRPSRGIEHLRSDESRRGRCRPRHPEMDEHQPGRVAVKTPIW
jgi:hypothetical protein